MKEEKNGSRKTRIFISYSRKDKPFVRKLNDAIDAAGIEAWVDWEGIPLSSDWMAEITSAINGGDAFLFVISPDSLNSKICIDELEVGITNNKKIIPVLYREPEKTHKMHAKLASTNWVYLRSKKDDFKSTIPKLIEAIQTDLGWVQQHTRLLQRATEWDQKNKNNSYLLQGSDLDNGEHWMTESTADAARAVVPLQAEYISTSRKVAVKRQRNLTIGVGAALVLSVFLGIFAFLQRGAALESQKKAVSSQATAVANELARATQQAIAEVNAEAAALSAAEAAESAKNAKAQRSASEAKIYQDQAGELDTSTLLAIDAYQKLPNLVEAENILRHNIVLLPIPIEQMKVDGRIWTIKLSPDGEKFATVDSAGQACLWSINDGTKFFCAEHDGIVYDSAFSEDGSILVTGTEKGILTFWNANTGESIKSLELVGKIFDLNLHPGGRWLGVGQSNEVAIIDMKDLEKETNFHHEKAVTTEFDSSGTYMAIGTSDGYVTIWTVLTNFSSAGTRHNGEIFDVTFSPDSKWVVSAGQDSAARTAVTTLEGQKYSVKHGDWVEDIEFGPDSSWFATASDDNFVRIIDTATGQERLRMAHAGFVQKVRVSGDGKWLASTGYDNTVRIWDTATGGEVMQIPIDAIGWDIRFNADSTRIIAGDEEGNITLWDISQLRARTGFVQFTEFLHEAHFSPNGEWLAVNSDDRNIWLIKSDQLGNTKDNRKKLVAASDLTTNMAVSADSKWIAAVEYDSNGNNATYNRVILVSADGAQKSFLSHDNKLIDAVAFTPDSKQVITADENGLINVWNMEDGKKSYSLQADGVILSIAVSPNGKYLAAGIEEGNHSIVWDLTTQNQVSLNQVGRIVSIRFSNDGRLLATGSSEATIYLWKMEDGTFSRTENEFNVNGEVAAMEFSPDDKQLAVGDSTGFAYLMDIALGQEVARLPHIDTVTSVSFSPDGKQLATVSRKAVLLWDIQSIPLVTRDDLVEIACLRMTKNFDQSKWKLVFFEDEYYPICPNLPAGGN